AAPPLMCNRIGKQPRIAHSSPDVRPANGGDFRRPGSWNSIGRQLDDVQLGRFRYAEGAGEVGEFAQRGLAVILRRWFVRIDGVDMDIRRSSNRRREFTGNNGPGKSRPGPVEVVLLASGRRRRVGRSTSYDLVTCRQ